MSRVLLINPAKEVPLLDWTMRYPPLGLMSVAAALDGHEVEILDMKVERVSGRVLRQKMSWADVVGITVLTPSIDAALDLCRIAKEQAAMTVMGGVHPSLMPDVVANPEVDVVVRGEGELTFREIADGRPLEVISGISYVSGSGLVHNPERPSACLSELPPPRRDLIAKNITRYKAFGMSMNSVSTARGCPYRCSFCCVPEVWSGYRELSPAEVVDEIKRVRGARIVSFVDDNFCHDMSRVESICDLIIREGLDDSIYSVFSRVDSIVMHPEVVAKMARANMRVVFIGIEAATQAALDRMNKKTRIEDIYRACEILEANGIFIWAGHIVGNLDDTYEDVEALIRMSRELPLDLADFTVITPYPGTGLFAAAREQNLIDYYDFAEYCECEPHMHTAHLSRMEIMELQIKAYLKFYGFLPMLRRARRWSGSKDKDWILRGNISGIGSFLKFRNRSAFYFWRAYKETVGKTQETRIRRYSPMVSTPVLYSIAAGAVAAAITFWLTYLVSGRYGAYSSRPLAFVVGDLLFSSLLVAFVCAMVAAWLAVRSYRRGWIFSVRRRKHARRERSLSGWSLLSGAVYAAAALVLTMALVSAAVIGGLSSHLTYGAKEVLVTCIAFLAAGAASYVSIRAVRNGEIARG